MWANPQSVIGAQLNRTLGVHVRMCPRENFDRYVCQLQVAYDQPKSRMNQGNCYAERILGKVCT